MSHSNTFRYNPQKLLYLSGWSWFQFSIPEKMQNSISEWVVYFSNFRFYEEWTCNVQISDFWIFNYFIFKISDIGLLWSEITIFIIEITLKLSHTKYGWNNTNLFHSGWAWKVQNLTFSHFWQLKIYRIHKHSNTCHPLNFHRIFFF